MPGLGRSPRGGNGNPLQYSCLENSMDRAAWQATVHGVAKSRLQLKQLTTAHAHKITSSSIFRLTRGCEPCFETVWVGILL